MSLRRAYIFTAPLVGILAASIGCQSGKRPAVAVPPTAPPPAVTAAQSQVSEPAVLKPTEAPRQEPKPDQVGELISNVEKEYNTGQSSFYAGNHEAAKQSFDRAFDLLVNSKLDPHSDPRLQAEYDKVLAAVNSIGPEATSQAEAAPPQASEPAPIDEANEAAPAVDPSVKAKAEAEVRATHSDLPLMLNDQVAAYINYFSNRGRGILERALARSGRYQEMIHRVLKEEGLPQDLIYLAQAESGFHPLAVSRAGARGMWQFMAFRGRSYGLLRDNWVDERQDPEKSTRAAARHLRDLYNQFGDWYLAMAAYNSGPGNVQQAVKRTGYADFWQLYKRNVLPGETRNYVPIILAVTIMAKNPAQYGLEDVRPDEPLPYESVEIDYPVDLRLVAQCIDVSPSVVQDLNPSLLRWTTPSGRPFDLRLPVGTKEKYLAAIAPIPEDMRPWWRMHTVSSGDTLYSIARIYRTTPQALIKANDLSDKGLGPGNKLIIPLAPAGDNAGLSFSRLATRYKVHAGDTVQSVAENFGVPASMVQRWNRLKGNSVKGRRVLYIHLPVQPGTPGAQVMAASTRNSSKSKSFANNHLQTITKKLPPPVRHKVKRGETLSSIANAYNTTVDAIRKDNRNVNVALLRAGTVLVINHKH